MPRSANKAKPRPDNSSYADFHKKIRETTAASHLLDMAEKIRANRRLPPRHAVSVLFVGSAEVRRQLEASVTLLSPQLGADPLLPADDGPTPDLLLIEATWHCDPPGLRTALLRLDDATNPLGALLRWASAAAIPTVAWFTESIADSEPFWPLAAHTDFSGFASATWEQDIRAAGLQRPPRCGYLPFAFSPGLINPYRFGVYPRRVLFEELFMLFDGMNQLLFEEDPDLIGQISDFLDYRAYFTESDQFCRTRPDWLSLPLMTRFIGSAAPATIEKLVRTAHFLLDYTPAAGSRPRFSSFSTLRAAASATIPLRNHSPGAAPHPVVDDLETGDHAGNMALIESLTHDPVRMYALQSRLFRRATREHAWGRRLLQLGDSIGIDYSDGINLTPRVSVICPTMRPDFTPLILQNFEGQRYPNKELIVVFNCARDLCSTAMEQIHERGHQAYWVPADKTIGVAINTGLAYATGDYWAKFDDDDLYFENYLEEPMLTRQAVDFDIYGKCNIQNYFQAEDLSIVRRGKWMAFTDDVYLAGGTFVSRRTPEGEFRMFPEGIRGYADVEFVLRNERDASVIVSGSEFDFVQVRYADNAHHTWDHKQHDMSLSYIACEGLDPARLAILGGDEQ